MHPSRLRARYRRVMAFFTRQTISFIFWEIILARLGLRRISRRTRPTRLHRAAVEFRALAIQLGGVWIKVGQFLSSRLDVLPPEVTDELSGLQDEVPPEDFTAIRRLAEAELGASLEERFAEFDPLPLAAASLGQVHRARLRLDAPQTDSFSQVVVKIQRPYIDRLIEVDLSALRRVGGWLQKYEPIRKRVNVPALIQEFADTISQEIDYLAEGKNAETFSSNFAERPRVHVPRVVWELTTRRVLTLEDVYAIKITDYEQITSAGIDRSQVATELLDIYLQQIFQDGFFHADPHPGNLFITPVPEEEQGWRLTFVDFGMVGHVPENLRAGLRELLIAVGTQDAGRVVKAYQMMNVLLPGADLQLIEQAEAQLFERFWGMSMRELRQISHAEMLGFARQFRQLMYQMPFQLPHNLLLLGRTVAILSGMCTGLDPNFNVWAQLEPYAQKLITEEAVGNWRVWLDEIGEGFRLLLSLPGKTDRALSLMAEGKLAVQTPQLDQRVARLERAINRLYGGLVASTLLGSGTLLIVNGQHTLGSIFLAGGVAAALWSLFFPPFSPPSE